MNIEMIKTAQDGTGLDDLARHLVRLLTPVCRRRYGQLGDDVVQDVLLQIVCSFKNVEFLSLEHFCSWVWSIVRSKSCDTFRAENRRRFATINFDVPYYGHEGHMFEIKRLLSMPEFYLLRYLAEGYKHAELGPKSKVFSELRKQRRKFAELI